jgi:hypothetical protein
VEKSKSQDVFNPHTLVELKQNICETISSIEVSELKLVSIYSRDLKRVYEQKGDILSIYCDVESFEQCIYFQKCTYVFTMGGISSARRQ